MCGVCRAVACGTCGSSCQDQARLPTSPLPTTAACLNLSVSHRHARPLRQHTHNTPPLPATATVRVRVNLHSTPIMPPFPVAPLPHRLLPPPRGLVSAALSAVHSSLSYGACCVCVWLVVCFAALVCSKSTPASRTKASRASSYRPSAHTTAAHLSRRFTSITPSSSSNKSSRCPPSTPHARLPACGDAATRGVVCWGVAC